MTRNKFFENADNINFCRCGCGQKLEWAPWWKPSNHPIYIRGHWIWGHKNPRWRGGRIYDSYGYILILKPDHKFCNNHGYVREHRLIYEEYHKCCLLSWAVMDHINGVRDDNKIENLEVKTQSKHMSRHFKKDFTGRKCSICDSDKTRINKNGYTNWYGNEKGGIKCDKCHEREYRESGKRRENKIKKRLLKGK